MTTEVILILLGIGVFAGILSGLFGVGGGIVIVPSLIAIFSYLHHQPQYLVHSAIATSLFIIIFTSFSSTYKQARHKNVIFSAALITGCFSAISVYIFSKVAVGLPGDTLKKIFSCILILIGIRMLFVNNREKQVQENQSEQFKYNKSRCSFIGIISGSIAAFTGLGGGIFTVPMLHYFLKLPIKKSIGTSSAAIFLTSIAGVMSYFVNSPADFQHNEISLGMVNIMYALPIIITSVPFAQLGVYLNKKSSHKLLTRLFAVFVLIISIRMILF